MNSFEEKTILVGVDGRHYQVFNGINYYLRFDGYYRANVGKYRLMHRAVYAYFNGEITSDIHIHHKDNDKSNNALSNLEALPKHIHHRLHVEENLSKDGNFYSKLGKFCSGKRMEVDPTSYLMQLNEAGKIGRQKQKELLQTPEGKIRKSLVVKLGHLKRPTYTKQCRNCGQSFTTKSKKAKSCSNRCNIIFNRNAKKISTLLN